MKRMLVITICFLLMCSFSATASAEDNSIYENAGQLHEAWVSQGEVPDYISGVWSTDGGQDNLTFGVVKGEAGEKGRQEILALVRDDSTVTIVQQTYSRNYLYRIQEEIVGSYFDQGLGLMTAGVLEYENRLYFEIDSSFSDNTDTLAMIRQITAQYGDAVYFSFTDSEIRFVIETQPIVSAPVWILANPQKQRVFPDPVLPLCAMAMALLFLIRMRRRRYGAIGAGRTFLVTNAPHITRKEAQAAIRKALICPSSTLDDRVAESIGHHHS